jgi:hypothetical protein
MKGGFIVRANGVSRDFRTIKQAKQAAMTVSQFGIPAEVIPVVTRESDQVEIYEYDEYGQETVVWGYSYPRRMNGRLIGYGVSKYEGRR